jgi:hypothetical protein
MGIWAWLILLANSGVLATTGQCLFFHTIRPLSTDYDWVYMAGGALLGGFTANLWYGSAWNMGPVVEWLYLAPALLCALILGAVVEAIYRLFIWPRQAT